MKKIKQHINRVFNKIKIWWLMRSVKKDIQRIDKDINDKLSR